MIEKLRMWDDTPLFALALVVVCIGMSAVLNRPPQAYAMSYLAGLAVYIGVVLVRSEPTYAQ